MKRSHSIHGIVKFEIVDKTRFPRSVLDKTRSQFANFISGDGGTIDFRVEIGPFGRRNRSSYVLDDRYCVGKDYFFCRDKRKFAKWALEVNGVETFPVVRLRTNLAGYYTVPLNVTEFMIQYMLLRKGMALVHASGVVKDGVCWLFAARGGAGKTTLALSLIDDGFGYLGDNFVLLDRGRAWSFLSPLNIFTYNRARIIREHLNARQRASMALKQLIHMLTRGYIKIFEKVNPRAVFPESIVDEARVGCICVLQPHSADGSNIPVVRPLGYSELIKKLRYNMELDLLLFNKYMFSYGYLYTDSLWCNFWDEYEAALMRNIPDSVPRYVAEVPPKWTPDVVAYLSRCCCGGALAWE